MSNVKATAKTKNLKRKKIARERIILVIAAVIVIAGNVMVRGLFADAHGTAKEDPIEYTYYKSIEIQSGDTLWGIAEQYSDGESIPDYIEKLKILNGLGSSDDIHESRYLTVIYKDDEFRK